MSSRFGARAPRCAVRVMVHAMVSVLLGAAGACTAAEPPPIDPRVPIGRSTDLSHDPKAEQELTALLDQFCSDRGGTGRALRHAKAEAQILTAFIRRHPNARCALLAKALLGRITLDAELGKYEEAAMQELASLTKGYPKTHAAVLARIWLARHRRSLTWDDYGREGTQASVKRYKEAIRAHKRAVESALPAAEMMMKERSALMTSLLKLEENADAAWFRIFLLTNIATELYRLGEVERARSILKEHAKADGDENLRWAAQDSLEYIDEWEKSPLRERPYHIVPFADDKGGTLKDETNKKAGLDEKK